MKAIEALAKILSWNQPLFRTADVAALLHIDNTHASKTLERLLESRQIVRIARSLWTIADKADPLFIPEQLTSPWPSYISLQTALYYHGMITQIPSLVYAVSLAKTKRYQTPLGVFSIHHLSPDFFFGYEGLGKSAIKMATREKALIDLLYLNPVKSGLFKNFPEIELSTHFRIGVARQTIRKIKSLKKRKQVQKLFEAILKSR